MPEIRTCRNGHQYAPETKSAWYSPAKNRWSCKQCDINAGKRRRARKNVNYRERHVPPQDDKAAQLHLTLWQDRQAT